MERKNHECRISRCSRVEFTRVDAGSFVRVAHTGKSGRTRPDHDGDSDDSSSVSSQASAVSATASGVGAKVNTLA